MSRTERRVVRILAVAYPAVAVAGLVLGILGMARRLSVSAFVGGLLAGLAVGLTVATLWWHQSNRWYQSCQETAAARDRWHELAMASREEVGQ